MPIQAGAEGAVVGDDAQGDQGKQIQGADAGPSNADVKSSPLFQKLAAELKELRDAEAARVASESEKKKQKEIEDAKRKADFETALKLEKEAAEAKIKEIEATAKAAEAAALQARMEAALLAKGAKHSKGLVRVAVAEYDPSKQPSIEAFVDEFKANPDFSALFGTQERQPFAPPVGTPVNQGAVVWNDSFKAQVKAWETGTDPEKRKEAIKLISEYRKQHGDYPYR